MKFESRFERCTPEEAGIRTEDIYELLSSYTDGNIAEEVHAYALLWRGKILSEGAFSPFRPEEEHEIFSGTKMFVGTAIGFAEAEGLLGENERLADIFPELLPENAPQELYELNISHLLSMALGMEGQAVHTLSSLATDERPFSRVRAILARPFVHAPGKVFSYDNEASYLLSAVITRKTGLSLEEYLTPRLFAPLGMNTPSFGKDKDGVSYGYMGARITIEDYALLGELYRLGGVYNGKRILPEGFAEKAVAKRIDTQPMPGADWGEGYATHFWRGRHGSFRFCGAFGQMCAVFPEKELVFAVFSGADYFNIPHILEKFYDKILARMSASPLPPKQDSQALLRFEKDLSLPHLYSSLPPTLPFFEKKPFRLLGTDAYDTLSLTHTSDSLIFDFKKEEESAKVAVGLFSPLRTVVPKEKTRFPYPTEKHDTLLSSAAFFESTETLVATLRLLGTPYAITLKLSIKDFTAELSIIRQI